MTNSIEFPDRRQPDDPLLVNSTYLGASAQKQKFESRSPDPATLARWAENRKRYAAKPPPLGAVHPGTLTPAIHDPSLSTWLVDGEQFRRKRQHQHREDFGVQVSVYENQLEIKHLYRDPVPRGVRGEVKGYSKQSRRRLITKLNSLHWPDDRICFFVTLTYPDHFERDWQRVKRQFANLRRSLVRHLPDAGVIWRLELKRRKSGANVGQIAPHFHLFLFTATATTDLDKFLRAAWHRIAGSGDVYHLQHGTKIQTLFNRRVAQSYISKYMSKEDDAETLSFGRVWGSYGKLEFSPVSQKSLSMAQWQVFYQLLIDYLDQVRPTSAEFMRTTGFLSSVRLYGLGTRTSEDEPDDLSPVMQLLRSIPGLERQQAAYQAYDDKVSLPIHREYFSSLTLP